MRRVFLSIIVLLAALGLEAQNGVNYVYTQGFEDGTLPEGWSSESVRGQSAWVVENGSAGNPEGAHGGTYRAALRNQGNLSTGDITRLVTPQIDLAGVWQPILVFSHAQAMRSGDNDTLRIYYRTSPTANWVLLQEYADRINRWRNDTVALDAPTSTYQIAFEGTDNMGHGIVIDDVIVRPGITCEVPHDIKCNAGSDEATLQWQASFDTETFRVVIATEQFASVDAVNPASIVVDATTDLFQYSTGKVLANNTTYYAYIAASCKPDDFAMFTFRTRNLVNVPYRATFNLPYESGMINRLASWTYGTDITKSTTDPTLVYTPFINTNTATTNLKQVSVDGTTALIFSGTTQGSLTSTIAKGKYSYAATPELNVDRVNTLQVSFWGSAYSYVGTTYMSSIIVGVMTNPGDKNTFVPVETCTVTTKNHHEHFTVSLAGYTGSGKYVAFMSDFADKINLFYLDNVVIEPIQAVKQAEMPRISNARSKGLTVNVAPSIGTWNVRIAKSFAADFSTVSAADVVYSQDGVTTKSLDVALSGMEGKELFVYVQSVSGTQTSAWSLPVQIRLPEHVGTMPVTYGFESEFDSTYLISERLRYYSYTSTYSLPSYVLYKPDTVGTSYWPYITTSTSTNAGANGSKGYLIFNKLGQCVVFPEVDAVNKIILDFYIEEYSSSTTYKEAAAVEVGVMTDPYDTTTFHSMGVYKADAYNQYNHYVVPLLDYTGDGHFIALRAAKNNKTTYYSKVDNVTFTEAGDCVLPTYLQSEVAGDKVNITWAANGMNKWKVRIGTDAGLKAPLAVDESVSTNSYTFTGFKYSTTYYYAVFTDCDGALTSSDTLSFKTGCDPDGMAVPYTMDFESYTGGLSTKVMPDCWTTEFYTSGTSNYPYIVSGTTYAHAGSRALYFGNSTVKRITYIALPALSTDINKLQLSLWIRGSATSTNGTLDVGVMTDPASMTTFTAVGEISVSGNVYAEKTVDLSGYTGSGHYIAIRKKTADALIYYIDDISVVERKDCGKVAVLTAKEPTRNGATIEWKDVQHESKWEVVVMTESLRDSEIDDAALADKILYRAQVTDTALVLSDDRLQPNSVYYVRVRAMCSEESIGDWSEAVSFQTQCVDMDPRTVGMIDFSNNAQTHFFDCWTVGIREDNATGTYATALPNIAGSATGAFGFYLYIQNKAYTSATNCGSTGAYAILPRISDSEDIRKWQMSFDACTNSTAATNLNRLQVGVITQLNDFSTFVPVKTLDLTYATDSTESTRYTVSFDKYMGDYNDDLGHYIMFYSDVDQKSNYIIVDNIKFDTIRACATPEPDMIRPVVDSVYITWPNTGAGKYLIDLYDEDGELLRTGMTADTAYAFGQLDISTTYEITVRGVCGQDTSYHSMRETFMTTCPVAYGLPYEEDFERYKAGTSAIYYHPACWETYFNGFSGAQARYPNIVTTGYNGSTRAINMQVLHTSTASTPSYAALPAINADLSKAMITLYARADNNLDPYSDYKVRQVAIGISTDVSSLLRLQSTFTPIDTITVSSTEYVRYNHDFSQYAGDGKYIVFQAIDGRAGYSGSGDNAVMIDNIRVELIPTCYRPEEVHTTEATTSALAIGWSDYGTATAWQVACVPAGASLTTATIKDVTEKAYRAEGLTASTDYDFYVRSKCSDTDFSEWTGPIAVTTACKVSLAEARWDFDDPSQKHLTTLSSTAAQVIDNCWLAGNKQSTTPTQIPMTVQNYLNVTTGLVTTRYARSGNYALRLTSGDKYNGAYAVAPEVDADMNSLQVRFMARATYETTTSGVSQSSAKSTAARSLRVGTMSNPLDPASFEQLAVITLDPIDASSVSASSDPEGMDYWRECIVPLNGAQGRFVAFLSEFDTDNTMYIDDVVIETATGCVVPNKLAVDETTFYDGNADLTWNSAATQWNARLIQGNDTTKYALSVPKVSINTLKPETDYIFEVQAVCDATHASTWQRIAFRTACNRVQKSDAAWTFNDRLVNYSTSTTRYEIPECWETGYYNNISKKYATGDANCPRVYDNTLLSGKLSIVYSHSENVYDRCLRFYSTSNYFNNYVILPDIAFDYKDYVLHFFMRASCHGKTNDEILSNRTSDNWILVGVVQDDDISTFQMLDTVRATTFESNVSINDPSVVDFGWDEISLPLARYAAQGGRIALMTPKSTTTSTNTVYIDDFEITDRVLCEEVTGLVASQLDSKSATIRWNNEDADRVIVQLTADSLFSEDAILSSDTISGTQLHFDNLQKNTRYNVRIARMCSETHFSRWTAVSFATPATVRYSEDFSSYNAELVPDNWTRYSGTLERFSERGLAGLSRQTTASTLGWRVRTAVNYGLPTTHVSNSYSTSSARYWLLSPAVEIEQGTENLMLSFDLALTGTDNAPVKDMGDRGRLVIFLSDDNGQTWTAPEQLIWNNDGTAGKRLADIAFGGERVFYDMNAYKGKTVQILFYTASDTTSMANYLHLDNVQINHYTEMTYSNDLCQRDDYEDDLFMRTADQLNVGMNRLQLYEQARQDGQADRLTTLNLMVNTVDETSLADRICEGEQYMKNGFNFTATHDGLYKLKLNGSNGCDSVVSLQLTLNHAVRVPEEVEICQGKSFEWHQKTYYTSTVVSDTLTSLVTGCDSVVTLYLTVAPAPQTTEDVPLCFGGTLELGSIVITEEGTYTATLITESGCDSIVTWNVSALPDMRSYKRVAICAGEAYTDQSFIGLSRPGHYEAQTTSVEGCDSTSVLDLLVADVNGMVYDTIDVDQLPYVVNGQEVVPEGATHGNFSLQLTDIGCGSITVMVRLGDNTALRDLQADNVIVYPNPVRGGTMFGIELPGVTSISMRMYNQVGSLITTAQTQGSRMVVEAPAEAGMYMLLLSDADGRICHGKLIVR